jgi:hypothetical protein
MQRAVLAKHRIKSSRVIISPACYSGLHWRGEGPRKKVLLFWLLAQPDSVPGVGVWMGDPPCRPCPEAAQNLIETLVRTRIADQSLVIHFETCLHSTQSYSVTSAHAHVTMEGSTERGRTRRVVANRLSRPRRRAPSQAAQGAKQRTFFRGPSPLQCKPLYKARCRNLRCVIRDAAAGGRAGGIGAPPARMRRVHGSNGVPDTGARNDATPAACLISGDPEGLAYRA